MKSFLINMGILAKINTKNELDKFLQQIDVLGGSLYKTKKTEKAPELIQSEFEAIGDGKEGISAKQDLLEKITREVSTAEVLEMKIPNQLPPQNEAEICSEVKKAVGEDVVLDFIVEPSVLVGVELTFNGKFKSYSLKDALEKDIWRYLTTI